MLQLVTNWIDKLRVKRNISPIFGIRVVCVLSIFYSAYCLVPWALCVGTKYNKNKQNASLLGFHSCHFHFPLHKTDLTVI